MSVLLPNPLTTLKLSHDTASHLLDKKRTIHTIIDELSPSPEYTQLDKVLELTGYNGDPADVDDVFSFLLSTLQAHRILSHHRTDAAKLTPSAHYRLSKSVTRLFHALDTAPALSQLETPHDLACEIDNVNSHVKSSVADYSKPHFKPILSSQERTSLMKSPHQQLAQSILNDLQKEHTTRIGLLLTRLKVTTLSFSRSERALDHPQAFLALSRKSATLQARWAHPQPITVFQALASKQFVLVDAQLRKLSLQNRIPSKVKSFVMGKVPDRGGRIAAGSEMPQFQQRAQNDSDAVHRKHGGHTRRKGAGKRRNKR